MAGIAPQPQPDTSAQSNQDNPDQPTQQGPDELGDEEGLQPNVSPDEQKAYEQFVLAGMMLIYQKTPDGKAQVRPAILKLLDDDHSDLKAVLKIPQLAQDNSPLVALAATAVIIVLQIIKTAGAIDRPSDDVILHGGVAILEELAEIWMRANPGQQLGEDEIHRALSMAADIYREVGADMGLVDTNTLKQQFAELVQADKSGNLASISPDLAGINQAAQINAQDGDPVPSPGQGDQGDQNQPPQQEQQ